MNRDIMEMSVLEAHLMQENKLLRGEVKYLRDLVHGTQPGMTIEPSHATHEITLQSTPPRVFQLPMIGRFTAQLAEQGRVHVLAQTMFPDRQKNLTRAYYAPTPDAPGVSFDGFVNTILPQMHLRLLGDIADYFKSENKL